MNILISDSWLRDFLKTKATPTQLKEYVSLCGPSIERIHEKNGEIIYDIEITTNRPDAMSVIGIAREAAAILPRFGIEAAVLHDPYQQKYKEQRITAKDEKKLTIKTDPALNPRWTSVVLSNIKVGPSPAWLAKRLEATDIRPINTVVDITNYLMRTYGQPTHAFSYDEIKQGKMLLRESKKGEKIVTLDGKTHILPGGDIVIEDGDGRLIDLCGIMGGYNSSITPSTTSVVLFTQTYDPSHIRKTSMALAHRTDAATLFEKGIDTELSRPVLMEGIALMGDLTGAKIASTITDIYPKPYKPVTVSVTKEKLFAYIGSPVKNVSSILSPLGFHTKEDAKKITVTVPSFRRDVAMDVDTIEEVARIYGYHTIVPTLPSEPPPMTQPDPQFGREQEIKIRLRDFGYTELFTYSMISEKLMDQFMLDRSNAYKIANPLSDEWVYMRPSLVPSVLTALRENLKHQQDLQLFELSHIYSYKKNDLPEQIPTLVVVWSGQKRRQAKGLMEALGLDGTIEELDETKRQQMGIKVPVTIATATVTPNTQRHTYVPIPKYPPVIEDFSFVVPPEFQVGPFIDVVSKIHKLIQSVVLLDAYENKRTFRVTYLDPEKTLTNLDVAPVHQKFLEYAAEKFGISPVI